MSQPDQRARVTALAASMAPVIAEAAALKPFEGRVSRRVAEALVAAGIDAPERLLLISKDETAALQGIGAAARREILAYRSRFLPN